MSDARVDAAIALGSNLGDRAAILDRAVAALDAIEGVEVVARSRWIETDPVGPPGQGPYLNGAVRVRTRLEPRRLLSCLLAIEQDEGRERRRGERWGPRTLDLDLLLHGDRVIDEDGLEVPHPRMAERRFVLEPLAEVAGDLVHPRLGRTVADLAAGLAAAAPVRSAGSPAEAPSGSGNRPAAAAGPGASVPASTTAPTPPME